MNLSSYRTLHRHNRRRAGADLRLAGAFAMAAVFGGWALAMTLDWHVEEQAEQARRLMLEGIAANCLPQGAGQMVAITWRAEGLFCTRYATETDKPGRPRVVLQTAMVEGLQ